MATELHEQQLRALVANSPFGIYRFVGNSCVYVNQRLCEVMGLSAESLTSGGWASAVHPDDLEPLRARWAQAAAACQNISAEYRIVRPDGSVVWIASEARPELGPRGELLGYVGTVIDITERKDAQLAILRLNAELEDRVRERTASLDAANRELATFTYTVSHDLKAPLRSIDGYSRLLMQDYADKLDDEGRSFLHIVRKSAGQMSKLIDDLLAYAHLETRTQIFAPIDVHALVELLLAERVADIRERGVTIRMPDACPTVLADRDALGLVLRNLLENALKFSVDQPAPMIEVGGREEPRAWLLWVRDNGAGFDMRFHDRIFEIFQRLHRAEDFPGTGVGLAIARKAMERMGGQIWAESELGKGSTFYLAIPRKAG